MNVLPLIALLMSDDPWHESIDGFQVEGRNAMRQDVMNDNGSMIKGGHWRENDSPHLPHATLFAKLRLIVFLRRNINLQRIFTRMLQIMSLVDGHKVDDTGP